MSTAPTAWRARPVFLTSTFRDMHAERDWLRHHVLPELEERLRQRLGHLEVIDLRWGVETVSAGEEQAKEMLVLKVCLAEIERSRPFLIGLIGDRYGWVPPAERLEAAAREAGYTAEVRGRSITALEIEYGVLESSDQRRRSHFYLRDPLPYDEMDPAVAADYSEAHTGDEQAPRRRAALDGLKGRIARQLPDRTHRYSATWDEERQTVTGLEAFGRMVLEHLWQDLEAEFPALAERARTTWQDEEQAALEEFIEQRNRDFVGREDLLRELVDFALGDPLTRSLSPSDGERVSARTGEEKALPRSLLSLTGPPGSGKSAVLCRLHRLLEREDALLLIHAAGVSLHAGSVDRMLLRWIGQLAAALGRPGPVDDTARPDDIEQAFSSLLGQAAGQRRVVVLVDALDQFEPTVRTRYLTWLPKLWPPHARLIATAIPGDASHALEARGTLGVPASAGPGAAANDPNRLKAGLPTASPAGVVAWTLAPLQRPEAELMAERVCSRYHRQVPPDVVQILVTKQTSEGEPAAGSPLWLELALEELNLLDQDDFQRAEKTYPGGAEEKLRQLLLDTARALPPDVEGLYGGMFDRAGELWGKPWADALLTLTALSRAGWRESDLQNLLPKAAEILAPAEHPLSRPAATLSPSGGEGRGEGASGAYAWDPLRFAGLRRSFRAHLARRGALGQWDFHHAQTRRAVTALRLVAADTVKSLHALCADHLLALPPTDPLREREMMVHLMGANDQSGAANYYGSELTDTEEAGATHALVNFLITTTDGLTEQVLAWVAELPGLDRLRDDTRATICNRFNFCLADALAPIASLPVRRRLLSAACETLERLATQDSSNATLEHSLFVSYLKLGDILLAQGDITAALATYRKDRSIAERLVAQNPSNAHWQQDLGASNDRVGDILELKGDLSGAMEAFREKLKITERLAAQDPSNSRDAHNLYVAHLKVGDVLKRQGNFAKAMKAYRSGIAVAEHVLVQNPRDYDHQRDLSISYERVGDLVLAKSDVLPRLQSQAEALESYQTSLAIREGLVAQDPTNAVWQHDLSVIHYKRGQLQGRQGKFSDALSSYQVALVIREGLVTQDPTNANWQRSLLICHARIGDVLKAQRDLVGALAANRRALAAAEHLAAEAPTNTELQRDLACLNHNIGTALVDQGDGVGAQKALLLSLAIEERLVALDSTNDQWKHDLIRTQNNLGTLLLARGNFSGVVHVCKAMFAISKRTTAAICSSLAPRVHNLLVGLGTPVICLIVFPIFSIVAAKVTIDTAIKVHRR